MAGFAFRRALLIVLVTGFLLPSGCSKRPAGELRVQGPGMQPQLGFACCDQGLDEAQSLFAQPGVLTQLQSLHATIAVPTLDFSAQRANLVRTLHQQGIPVIAWIMLAKEKGYYLNADNAQEAAARLTAFEQWTSANNLHWAAVGLDIEPNFAALGQLRGHRWRLAMTLLGRSVELGRLRRARKAYAELIGLIHTWGYPVQIYAMPYVPAERAVHSSLADRLLGTVDVRGDQNYLMLYTTSARRVGAAMIWSLGRNAWGITVGSTDGLGTPGQGNGPLDWTEFSRDLIVASHFTPHIGVYNLEGCIRQGFLPRLLAMNWSQTVVIPAAQAQRAERIGWLSRSVLWVGSNLICLVAAALILSWLVWRRRRRRRAPLS